MIGRQLVLASIIERLITSVPGSLAYLLIFLLPALEASIFLGFVIPGETAVVLGGVLAYHSRISLYGALACAIAGAIIGDNIGYEVGHHYGERARSTRIGQLVGNRRWQLVDEFLHRRRGSAIFIGRFTALLRALVPAAAGMAHIRYRTFLLWNAIGGATWATSFTLLGYLAGSAYQRVERISSWLSVGLLILILAVILARHVRDR